MKKIIFKSMMAPGDVLMLQLAVRELHKCYPNLFETDIVSPYPEITYNNPLLTKLITNGMKDADAEIIDVGYDTEFKQSKFSGRHFSDGYITDINEKLGLDIRKANMYPSIYLKPEEMNKDEIREKYGLPTRFWIFNAGIKSDIPLKSWRLENWKEVIRWLSEKTYLVQVGSHAHIHPEFEGVHSLVGKTEDLREFLKLCYAAEGSIGPISMHMHIMAAFHKPCVVIAGGRETPSWEMYPTHQFFHTVGMLECCKDGGCLKKNRDECVYMVGLQKYPLCMSLIEYKDIYKAVRSYIEDMWYV